jgi:hypothetical protein
MVRKSSASVGLFAIGMLAIFASPAFADYYIVHGPDRHCRVVERWTPEDRDLIRVGPLRFGTRDEAEHDLKVVCRDNGYYREEVEHRDHEVR